MAPALAIGQQPEETEDFLYTCFQSCYHLRDWLPPDEYSEAQVQDLFEKNTVMRLCRDVCNATKHVEPTQTPARGKEPSLAREYVGPSVGWFGDDSILVILSGGDKLDAHELAGECLRLWEQFLSHSSAV